MSQILSIELNLFWTQNIPCVCVGCVCVRACACACVCVCVCVCNSSLLCSFKGMLSVKSTISPLSPLNYIKRTCCQSQTIPTAAGLLNRRTISDRHIPHRTVTTEFPSVLTLCSSSKWVVKSHKITQHFYFNTNTGSLNTAQLLELENTQ